MSVSNLCFPSSESALPRYFQNRILIFCLGIPTLIYLWEIYIFLGFFCLFCCSQIQYVDRSWGYINRSQTHECRNLGPRLHNSFSGNTLIRFSVQWSSYPLPTAISLSLSLSHLERGKEGIFTYPLLFSFLQFGILIPLWSSRKNIVSIDQKSYR